MVKLAAEGHDLIFWPLRWTFSWDWTLEQAITSAHLLPTCETKFWLVRSQMFDKNPQIFYWDLKSSDRHQTSLAKKGLERWKISHLTFSSFPAVVKRNLLSKTANNQQTKQDTSQHCGSSSSPPTWQLVPDYWRQSFLEAVWLLTMYKSWDY